MPSQGGAVLHRLCYQHCCYKIEVVTALVMVMVVLKSIATLLGCEVANLVAIVVGEGLGGQK